MKALTTSYSFLAFTPQPSRVVRRLASIAFSVETLSLMRSLTRKRNGLICRNDCRGKPGKNTPSCARLTLSSSFTSRIRASFGAVCGPRTHLWCQPNMSQRRARVDCGRSSFRARSTNCRSRPLPKPCGSRPGSMASVSCGARGLQGADRYDDHPSSASLTLPVSLSTAISSFFRPLEDSGADWDVQPRKHVLHVRRSTMFDSLF